MTASSPQIARRFVLMGGAALAACAPAALAGIDPWAASPWRKLSDADWKKRLSAASYDILRRNGTEAPGTSPLLAEHRAGTFVCLGCALPIFKSQWKFESGTGWPSFHTAIGGAVVKKQDLSLGFPRTEYHCARCLGHQGHIFEDGPRPTGLRYCNNGVGLKFIAA